jgi:hypothetical protein
MKQLDSAKFVANHWTLPNMEATMCTDAFIANCVAHFGVLIIVTMDRGAQFTSALWTDACTSLGIMHLVWVPRGILTFPGSWWACVQRLRRIMMSLQESWSMSHHSSPLASYCTCQILHVSMCHRRPWAASDVVVANTPPAHLPQVDHM